MCVSTYAGTVFDGLIVTVGRANFSRRFRYGVRWAMARRFTFFAYEVPTEPSESFAKVRVRCVDLDNDSRAATRASCLK